VTWKLLKVLCILLDGILSWSCIDKLQLSTGASLVTFNSSDPAGNQQCTISWCTGNNNYGVGELHVPDVFLTEAIFLILQLTILRLTNFP